MSLRAQLNGRCVIQNGIFDLDGTLVNSLPGIRLSIEVALAEFGLQPRARELRPLIGPPIRYILSSVAGVTEEYSLDRLERAFRSSYDERGWLRSACFSGARQLLRDLQAAGTRLFVLTNKTTLPTRNILRHLKLEAFFEEVVCRDSRAPSYTSKSEALADLVERRDLSPETCLLVGDTEEDRAAAIAAGMQSTIVRHGYGGDKSLGPPSWDEVRERFSAARELSRMENYDRP